VLHFVRDEARCPGCTSDDEILDTPVGSDPEFLDVDVERFMRSLDPSDRDLLVRRYRNDEPLSVVARSIGISRQTVHVRHKRLMAQGRDHLTPMSLVA
jgi:DNA-directed RNA polymerase specialized sigma24 family protein